MHRKVAALVGTDTLALGSNGSHIKPYEGDARGIPPMAAFGDGYRHHVTGLVHDERGFPTQNSLEIEAFQRRLFLCLGHTQVAGLTNLLFSLPNS